MICVPKEELLSGAFHFHPVVPADHGVREAAVLPVDFPVEADHREEEDPQGDGKINPPAAGKLIRRIQSRRDNRYTRLPQRNKTNPYSNLQIRASCF